MNLNEKQLIELVKNENKYELSQHWKDLNDNQKLMLFEVSLEEKDIAMRSWIYHLEPKLFELKKDELILSAGKKDNTKGMLFLLQKSSRYKHLENDFKFHSHTVLMLLLIEWAVENNAIDILKEEINKMVTPIQMDILMNMCLYDIKNEINKPFFCLNPKNQQLIEKLEQPFLQLKNCWRELLFKMISSEEIEATQYYIENYLKSESILLYLIKNDNNNIYGTYGGTVKNAIQYMMNAGLNKAAYNNQLEMIKVFIEHGANPNNENGMCIRFTLDQYDLQTLQYLVDSGADMSIHKENAIKKSSNANKIELTKYLITFFEDKEEAWNCIAGSNDFQMEVRSYINHIILEEKLQKELAKQEKTNQRKI